MPIRPENRHRYPKDWYLRSYFVRFVRARGQCERVQVGPVVVGCGAVNGRPHPITGATVVLTTAHVFNEAPEASSLLNLAAWCQKCHNGHDAKARQQRRRERLRRESGAARIIQGDSVRPCATPRCPTLVEQGHCPAHSRQQDQRRGSQRERGYTRRWEAAAKRFKDRHPLCGMRPKGQTPVMSQCYDEGRVTPVYQVDHVVPHRGDQRLFWDSEHNWQSLCASCGSRKSGAGL